MVPDEIPDLSPEVWAALAALSQEQLDALEAWGVDVDINVEVIVTPDPIPDPEFRAAATWIADSNVPAWLAISMLKDLIHRGIDPRPADPEPEEEDDPRPPDGVTLTTSYEGS